MTITFHGNVAISMSPFFPRGDSLTHIKKGRNQIARECLADVSQSVVSGISDMNTVKF